MRAVTNSTADTERGSKRSAAGSGFWTRLAEVFGRDQRDGRSMRRRDGSGLRPPVASAPAAATARREPRPWLNDHERARPRRARTRMTRPAAQHSRVAGAGARRLSAVVYSILVLRSSSLRYEANARRHDADVVMAVSLVVSRRVVLRSSAVRER